MALSSNMYYRITYKYKHYLVMSSILFQGKRHLTTGTGFAGEAHRGTATKHTGCESKSLSGSNLTGPPKYQITQTNH
jgi:hypothetical protein